MKKLFFVIMLLGFVGSMNANAQCSKSESGKSSCCANKSAMAKEDSDAAAKAASLDQSIVSKKVGEETVYQRKVVSEANGQATFVDVNYDAATGKFVNSTGCSGHSNGKACAGEGNAKAMKSKGKACCKSETATSKSCCSKKGDETSMAQPTPAKTMDR